MNLEQCYSESEDSFEQPYFRAKSPEYPFKSKENKHLNYLDDSQPEDDGPLEPIMKKIPASKSQPKFGIKSAVNLNPSNVATTYNYSTVRLKESSTIPIWKRPPQVPTKTRKLDSVTRFQQNSNFWKKDKFLKSCGGNAKQGRKLALDQRNKINKIA